MYPSSKKNVLKKLVAKPIIFNKIVGKNIVKKVPEIQEVFRKIQQNGVGSMQGSNEDCLSMKGHTDGGYALTVFAIERTHRGEDAPTM